MLTHFGRDAQGLYPGIVRQYAFDFSLHIYFLICRLTLYISVYLLF